jgi:peptidoglycan/xylan/chitin deacetylase (PgdA/CDA1 family)
MKRSGIVKAVYFMPPYEWYNDSIAAWTKEMHLQLINFSPGTGSNGDYTTPDMKNYKSSKDILESIKEYDKQFNLNGFILLMHIGTDPKRKDKFYLRLPELINFLAMRGYQFRRIDELLE